MLQDSVNCRAQPAVEKQHIMRCLTRTIKLLCCVIFAIVLHHVFAGGICAHAHIVQQLALGFIAGVFIGFGTLYNIHDCSWAGGVLKKSC